MRDLVIGATVSFVACLTGTVFAYVVHAENTSGLPATLTRSPESEPQFFTWRGLVTAIDTEKHTFTLSTYTPFSASTSIVARFTFDSRSLSSTTSAPYWNETRPETPLAIGSAVIVRTSRVSAGPLYAVRVRAVPL